MSDLFHDLYRFRERETKENEEDWLTECLAGVLRSLPEKCLISFFSAITGQSPSFIATVASQLAIQTQVTIQRGSNTTDRQRPDMIVFIDREPWLLFENKVSHGVDEVETEGGRLESQMHRYGEWLRRQPFSTPGLSPALVFVTHHTAVPADFLDSATEHPSYVGLGRHCSTWSHVGRLLDAVTSTLDESLHARVLVLAFQRYLEKHKMANDYPEYNDLAGLGLFVETVDRFSKLVDGMIDRLRGLVPFGGNVSWARAESEHGIYTAYRYLKPSAQWDANTYVAVGIWFPELGNGWYAEDIEELTGTAVSPSPKLYLQLANDEDDALTKIAGVPDEKWLRINSDLFLYRDFASFPGDPTERAIAIFAWVDTQGARLKRLLTA